MTLLETESKLDLSRHLSGSKLERLVHLKYCVVGGAGAATLSSRMLSLNWTALGHRQMRNREGPYFFFLLRLALGFFLAFTLGGP